MKNSILLLILLILLPLLLLGQTEFVQTKQSGLQICTAKTVHGTVVVNLPATMYPGETITGTVITEPEVTGNSRKDKLSRAALLARTLFIFGLPVAAGEQTFQLTVPENLPAERLLVDLIEANGEKTSAPVDIPEGIRQVVQRTEPAFPGFLRSGEYQNIPGNFDGLAGNTKLLLGDLEIPVVAESPGEVVTMVPPGLSGRNNLTITEAGTTFGKEVSVLDLNLTADATTLRRGQQSQVHVQVVGLEGVDQPVTVLVRNHTPMSISMAGGNTQEWTIDPSELAAGTTFQRDLQIVAISSGGFSVSAGIAEPFFPGVDTEADAEPEVKPKDGEEGKKEGGICGNTWSTEWKDTGKTIRKLDESQKTESRRNRSKCQKCGVYSEWIYYKIPEYSYKIQERTTTTCTMPKGHANFPQACHGSGVKENQEVKTGPVLRYQEVREGSCGCKETVRWTNR